MKAISMKRLMSASGLFLAGFALLAGCDDDPAKPAIQAAKCTSIENFELAQDLRKVAGNLAAGEYLAKEVQVRWNVQGKPVEGQVLYGNNNTTITTEVLCPQDDTSLAVLSQSTISTVEFFEKVYVDKNQNVYVDTRYGLYPVAELKMDISPQSANISVNAVSKQISTGKDYSLIEDMTTGKVEKTQNGLQVRFRGATDDVDSYVVVFEKIEGSDFTPPEGKPQPPVTPAPAPPSFGKSECLEKTGLKLGELTADDIEFDRDCSGVYVMSAPIKFLVNGSSFESLSCESDRTHEVSFWMDTSTRDALEKLKSLNQDLDELSFKYTASTPYNLSYLEIVRSNALYISAPSRQLNDFRRVVLIDGEQSGTLFLSTEGVCELSQAIENRGDLTLPEAFKNFLFKMFHIELI